jgi:hypothetical protein
MTDAAFEAEIKKWDAKAEDCRQFAEQAGRKLIGLPPDVPVGPRQGLVSLLEDERRMETAYRRVVLAIELAQAAAQQACDDSRAMRRVQG